MDDLGVAVLVGVFLSPAGYGIWRLLRGAMRGSWMRPSWFFSLLSTVLYLCVAFWLYGISIGGLDVGEACGGSWDQDYWLAHRGEVDQIFPLSVPCSSTVNLIPGWLNPLLAMLAALAVVGLVGFVATVVARTLAWGRGRPAGESTESSPRNLELEDC